MQKTLSKRRRLCLGAHLSVAGGVSRAVESAIELGTESLQIFTRQKGRWQQNPLPEAEVQRFHEFRETWGGGPVVSHGSYLINLASPDRALRAKSMRAFVDEVQRAERLGLLGVVMHPGAHMARGVEAGIRRIAGELRRVIDRTQDCSARVILENTAGAGTTLGRSFEELAMLLEQTDVPERTAVCLDSCHLHAAGYDMRTPRGYRDTMAELDATIGAQRVVCWHLNDSKGTLGSHLDRHEHIGEGEIGRAGFRRIVKDPRFFGVPKILETPKADDMDRVNLELLYGL